MQDELRLAAMKPAFDIHIHMEHHVVVTRGAVFIQVRNGPLTVQVLDRIEQTLRLWRARQAKAVAVIVVLEAGAAPATGPTRDRQREVIQTALAGDRAHLVTVLLGSGVLLSLQRTVARGYFKINSKIFMAASVPEGARWISKVLADTDERDVRESVEEARILLRDGEPIAPMSTRMRIQ